MNKLINSLLVCFVSLLFQTSLHASSDEIKVVRTLAQITSIMHTKGDVVWPGYDISETPTVITFQNGHVYAIDLSSTDSKWTRANQGGKPIFYSAIDHWGATQSPMNASFPLEGKQAFAFQFDGIQDPELRYLVFVHERFHSFQGEQYTRVETGAYRDSADVVNLAFIQLEGRILADFMEAAGNPSQQLELVKDFAAVNSVRTTFIHPDSVQWENEQQRMEGMADYVSMKVFEQFPFIKSMAIYQKIAEQLKSSLANDRLAEQAIKWRHYAVGNALGFILDFLGVQDWKIQVQNGQASLSGLIKQSVALSPTEISQRLERVEAYYHLPVIYNHIQIITLGSQEDSPEKLEQDFTAMQGVLVSLGRPQNARLSGGGSHLRMVYLADGSTLSVDDISATASSDNQWKIRFQNVPFLVQDRSGFKKFKIEEDAEIMIDHRQVSVRQLLAEQGQRHFDTLSWKAGTSEFSVQNHPGVIRCNEQGMTIEFTDS